MRGKIETKTTINVPREAGGVAKVETRVGVHVHARRYCVDQVHEIVALPVVTAAHILVIAICITIHVPKPQMPAVAPVHTLPQKHQQVFVPWVCRGQVALVARGLGPVRPSHCDGHEAIFLISNVLEGLFEFQLSPYFS